MIVKFGIIKNQILMWSEKQLIISRGKRTSLKLVENFALFSQIIKSMISNYILHEIQMLDDRDQP